MEGWETSRKLQWYPLFMMPTVADENINYSYQKKLMKCSVKVYEAEGLLLKPFVSCKYYRCNHKVARKY